MNRWPANVGAERPAGSQCSSGRFRAELLVRKPAPACITKASSTRVERCLSRPSSPLPRIADEHPRAAQLAYRIRAQAEELRAVPEPRTSTGRLGPKCRVRN